MPAYVRLVVSCRNERCLVANVGYVGAGEARGLPCKHVDIDACVNLYRFQMNLEYFLAFVKVWQVNVYLPVETARAEQCRVKHVGTVGGREDYYTAVCAESVHLRKQRVERVFALVIASHGRVLASCTAYGVDLVDEDDARRLLFCLPEKVAHTACADADEHLYEV